MEQNSGLEAYLASDAHGEHPYFFIFSSTQVFLENTGFCKTTRENQRRSLPTLATGFVEPFLLLLTVDGTVDGTVMFDPQDRHPHFPSFSTAKEKKWLASNSFCLLFSPVPYPPRNGVSEHACTYKMHRVWLCPCVTPSIVQENPAAVLRRRQGSRRVLLRPAQRAERVQV